MTRRPSMKESVPGLWHVLRYFWPWMRVERRLIAASMGALLLGVVVRLAEPWPLKFILDLVIPTERPPGMHAPSFIGELAPMTLLTISAVALVAITGLRALFDYIQKVGFAKIGNRVLRRVRDHVYVHLQGLSLSFHSKSRSGDLIVRVTRDVSLLRDVMATAVLPLFASVLILVGMAVVMLLLQWQLALLAMVTVPLFGYSTTKISRRIHEAARKQRQREGAMASTAAESITAIKVVQALSLEEVFAREFSNQNTQSQKEDLKAAKLSARLGRTVDVLLAVATALVMWYGAVLVIESRMTPGDLLVFLSYLKRAFNPAKDFAKYAARLAKATAAGERVLALLERTPEVRDLPGAEPAPSFVGAVRFDGVRFSYEEERQVLDGIDFAVEPGRFVALVGPSGIGKSTLVSLILRLYDPVEGRVLIDDRDIRDYTIPSLRSQIGVVLQDTILFAATVRENISHGLQDATPEQVEAAARLANAHEFVRALPDGYETVVGERGANLSHGQRQRIAIARAAIRDARILLLDEPTTGLDEENERTVVEALERLARGRTTFLITHDLRFAARADLVIYLEGGRILESGPPSRLLADGGRYADLYDLQTSREDSHGHGR